MADTPQTRQAVRFGVFEVDLAAHELRKNGLRVRLQDQPFQLLALLLERPGEVVTRVELREKLWPADTFVEFDHSLNTAVKKIRKALGDSASNPRFVETLPGIGYKFLTPVDGAGSTARANPNEIPSPKADPERTIRRQRVALVALAAALGIIAVLLLFGWWSEEPSRTPPPRRFAFTPPEPIRKIGPGFSRNVAISPDGRYIAFTPGGQHTKLWVLDLEQEQPGVIEGTDGAIGPFWSPDSQFVGFGTTDGALKKVSLRGGLAVPLCGLLDGAYYGGTWSPDGELIVFSSGTAALYEVAASGGSPALLIPREDSTEASSQGPTDAILEPHFLPPGAGSRVLAFSFGSRGGMTMMIQDLETGRREFPGEGHLPFYSPSGHLVYQAGPVTHDLWALPFSLNTLQATGEAFPIAQNSRAATVAGDGTLVYLDSDISEKEQLVWVDRRGEKVGEIGRVQEFIVDPALSPDGSRVAVSARENDHQDIWVYDTARDVPTLLSSPDTTDYGPIWSPTGEEIAFNSPPIRDSTVSVRRADGSGEVQVLLRGGETGFIPDWSHDGKYILFQVRDAETRHDLWYLERTEDGAGWEPHPFLETPFAELGAKLAPNGRFVAYFSNESGRDEVYVQPFPEGGHRTTISSKGGDQVRWSRDGQELFYVENRTTLLAVSVSTEGKFSVGRTRRLFEHPPFARSPSPQYDVSLDGERFIVAQAVGDAVEPSIRVVQNWFAAFRDRE